MRYVVPFLLALIVLIGCGGGKGPNETKLDQAIDEIKHSDKGTAADRDKAVQALESMREELRKQDQAASNSGGGSSSNSSSSSGGPPGPMSGGGFGPPK